MFDDDAQDPGGAEGGDHGEAVGAGLFVEGEEEEDGNLDVTISGIGDDEHDGVEEIPVEIDVDQAEYVLVKRPKSQGVKGQHGEFFRVRIRQGRGRSLGVCERIFSECSRRGRMSRVWRGYF